MIEAEFQLKRPSSAQMLKHYVSVMSFPLYKAFCKNNPSTCLGICLANKKCLPFLQWHDFQVGKWQGKNIFWVRMVLCSLLHIIIIIMMLICVSKFVQIARKELHLLCSLLILGLFLKTYVGYIWLFPCSFMLLKIENKTMSYSKLKWQLASWVHDDFGTWKQSHGSERLRNLGLQGLKSLDWIVYCAVTN